AATRRLLPPADCAPRRTRSPSDRSAELPRALTHDAANLGVPYLACLMLSVVSRVRTAGDAPGPRCMVGRMPRRSRLDQFRPALDQGGFRGFEPIRWSDPDARQRLLAAFGHPGTGRDA